MFWWDGITVYDPEPHLETLKETDPWLCYKAKYDFTCMSGIQHHKSTKPEEMLTLSRQSSDSGVLLHESTCELIRFKA